MCAKISYKRHFRFLGKKINLQNSTHMNNLKNVNISVSFLPGLHLRSIEEPQSRMPAVEGTFLGLDNNNSVRSGIQHPHTNNGSHNHHQNSHHYDFEHARMEAWLDEHQEFAQEYFIRKATRNVVDAWLVSHATPAALASNDMMTIVSSPTHVSQQQSASRNGSGATTPVR